MKQGAINNGTHRQGVAASNSCPEEDLDGDGYAAWEDCDDNDASVPSINDSDCNGIADVYGTCDGSETFSVQSVASGREVQGGVIADVDGDGYEDALFNEHLTTNFRFIGETTKLQFFQSYIAIDWSQWWTRCCRGF